MKAIIVAGGKGTRLRPLTENKPKPMIEVAGKPILEHTLNLLISHGINEFIFALCYLPNVIQNYFGDGSKFDVKIDYIYEDEQTPLGTAGAIVAASTAIKETFIVTYADILRKLNVRDMINKHQEKKAFATINVYQRFGIDPKSMIVFDEQDKINSFIERPSLDRINKEFVWANGSFYIFEPEIFNLIPKNSSVDFGKDIFPLLLTTKKRFYCYPTKDFFIDIGNHQKLSLAKDKFIPPELNSTKE
ncbi:MAG: nucleotidyltransferase family protein [Patescibacteria group bacterium]